MLAGTNRFSKRVKTVPFTKKSASTVAKAFTDSRVLVYGYHNGSFTTMGVTLRPNTSHTYASLGIPNLFMTTYHPQCNRQVERINRTIIVALRYYITDNSKEWDLHTHTLTYAYNTQIRLATGCTPFELTLSNPSQPLAVRLAV